MAEPTKKKATIADVVEVRREGKVMILPENLSYDRAIDVLARQRDYENETVNIQTTLNCMPQEGGVALLNVLKREFGFAMTKKSAFSDATSIEVQVDLNETISVPWGRFEVPGVDGWIGTDATENQEQRIVFQITAQVKRRHESIVQDLIAKVRDEVRANSIYKGKAWRIRRFDDRGRPLPLPEPVFIDLNPLVEQQLTFPEDVLASLQINLWSHIEHTAAHRKVGAQTKRGVLLVGTYGVGKSMSMHATMLKAVRNGWTSVVVDRPNELSDVIRDAREYGPVLVFCEDIDRVTDGERSIGFDELLNVIDGVESKAGEIIIVLTTNELDSIHDAMLRPGRIDGVITLREPDAEGAAKLLRIYSGALLSEDEDISEAAALIAGHKTSAVREVAVRAQSAAIWNTGGEPTTITADDLKMAALSVVNQLKGLERPDKDTRSERVKAAQILSQALQGTPAYRQAMAAEAVVAYEPDGNEQTMSDTHFTDTPEESEESLLDRTLNSESRTD